MFKKYTLSQVTKNVRLSFLTALFIWLVLLSICVFLIAVGTNKDMLPVLIVVTASIVLIGGYVINNLMYVKTCIENNEYKIVLDTFEKYDFSVIDIFLKLAGLLLLFSSIGNHWLIILANIIICFISFTLHLGKINFLQLGKLETEFTAVLPMSRKKQKCAVWLIPAKKTRKKIIVYYIPTSKIVSTPVKKETTFDNE